MSTKKILIVEDHPLIVKGLKQIIYSLSSETTIVDTDNCETFLSTVNAYKIEYCIVDLNLTDGMSFDSIDNILKLYPSTKILVYTSFPGAMYARRLFKIGIHGFLNKTADEEELRTCLKKFMNDEFYISPEFLPMMLTKNKNLNKFKLNPFDLLSLKEITVVEYLKEGISIKAISEKMGIMPNTSATYKKRAFQKLEIENILQLDSLYKSHGGKSKEFSEPENL